LRAPKDHKPTICQRQIRIYAFLFPRFNLSILMH
jgi:hypothetical protein